MRRQELGRSGRWDEMSKLSEAVRAGEERALGWHERALSEGPETAKPIVRSALVLSSICGALPLLLVTEDLIELGVGLGLLVDLLDLFLALLTDLVLQLL